MIDNRESDVMNFGFNQMARLFAIAVAAAAVLTPCRAGEMTLDWDPPASPDIVGYRVFYGTQASGSYGSSVDTDTAPTATLSGLSNCTRYSIAVKARDAGGLMSDGYSNVVTGFPYPEIATVTPSTAAVGDTITLDIRGMNFAPGATVALTNCTVVSTTTNACGQITAKVTVGAGASGASDLTVTNSDGGAATMPAALLIGSTPSLFTVASVTPPAGAGGVDPGSAVQVTFSRPVDPKTVTASKFRVLKTGGGSAKLAPGAPEIDAAGTTVTVHVLGTLLANQSYSVFVQGGRKGVLASGSIPLAANYTQPAAFTTAPLLAGVFYGPASADPSSYQALIAGSTVATDSALVVRFTEAIDPAKVILANFKLTLGSRRIQFKDGTLLVSPDGLSVSLVPSALLPTKASLTLTVKGTTTGIRSARGVAMAKTFSLSFSSSPGTVQDLGVAE